MYCFDCDETLFTVVGEVHPDSKDALYSQWRDVFVKIEASGYRP